MSLKVSLEQYLTETRIPLRLSCISSSGWPVVLSLWYLFEDNYLYCATPEGAKVVSYLRKESRCAFEVAADLPPYCGVRGQAIATILGNRGDEILERLLTRYLGSTDNALAQRLLERPQPEVAIRIEPQTLHTWDFSDRMAGAVSKVQKICPG